MVRSNTWNQAGAQRKMGAQSCQRIESIQHLSYSALRQYLAEFLWEKLSLSIKGPRIGMSLVSDPAPCSTHWEESCAGIF